MNLALSNYDNAYEAVLVLGKMTSQSAHLKSRTSPFVQTPDCCMLCLVHREIAGLCMVVEDLHLHVYLCILHHNCDLLGSFVCFSGID